MKNIIFADKRIKCENLQIVIQPAFYSRAECEVAMGNKYLDGTALTIVIIGAINWLLISIFRFVHVF